MGMFSCIVVCAFVQSCDLTLGGRSILSNPTPASYDRAGQLGQNATWPKISLILNQCKIEYALDDIVQRLRGLDSWQFIE